MALLIQAHPAAAAATDKRGHTPLHFAVLNDLGSDAESIALLIPLHKAATTQLRTDSIALLILAYPGAAAATSSRGETPLHLAAMARLTDDRMVVLVKAHPSAAVQKDNTGRVPLQNFLDNRVTGFTTPPDTTLLCRYGARIGQVVPSQWGDLNVYHPHPGGGGGGGGAYRARRRRWRSNAQVMAFLRKQARQPP